METLGHSQIGLTMNTYTILPDIGRTAVDAAAEIIFGGLPGPAGARPRPGLPGAGCGFLVGIFESGRSAADMPEPSRLHICAGERHPDIREVSSR
jgi:hypothetical protein